MDDGLHIVEFDDGGWINLHWLMFSSARKKFDEETGEEYFDTTFIFADGRGSKMNTRLDQDALDMVREAMV